MRSGSALIISSNQIPDYFLRYGNLQASMAATVATSSVAGFSPFLHCNISSNTSSARFKPLPRATSAPRSVLVTEQSSPATDTVRSENIKADTRLSAKHEHVGRAIGSSLNDFFQQATEILIRSDGGPPRWFSPLECGGSRLNNSPLLLYLPGIDCTGYGLMLHHQRLGEIFDVWCLHIPLSDRTPFTELVKLVETTVRSENELFPRRPIYLVGESFGGCLALAVASRNPDIDLVLILANPATCFSKSQLQPLIAMLKIIPDQLRLGLPYILSLMTGIPSRMVMAAAEKGFPSQETVADLSDTVAELLSYLSDLTDVLTVETLLWKLKMIEAACEYANSRLHAVSAHTLLLSSGRDQLLPSLEEGQRLRRLLPNSVIRTFNESGHNLFLEDVHDLVTIIKGASFYRRGRNTDYASDFLPPSPLEIEKIVHSDSLRLLDVATSPVMLSTLENGEIVRGLAGIPSEGPILFVGYHNMLGFEVTPMIRRILIERDILVRGLAHPMLFTKLAEGIMPDPSAYDVARVMGAVPATPSNFYKLLSVKSHVLLYPGGVREALHRKGEEYKLFWPQQSEFVRMAARFGATIVPFGAVGEDDFGQLVFDYNDQMKFPPMKALAEGLTNESVKLRTDFEGEVGNQDLHLPVLAPKLPGRYYYLFGKPIETKERKQELRSRGTAHELYLEVKSEVENCLAYLKERREHDPYRSIMARLLYQATHDPDSEIPSFEIR